MKNKLLHNIIIIIVIVFVIVIFFVVAFTTIISNNYIGGLCSYNSRNSRQKPTFSLPFSVPWSNQSQPSPQLFFHRREEILCLSRRWQPLTAGRICRLGNKTTSPSVNPPLEDRELSLVRDRYIDADVDSCIVAQLLRSLAWLLPSASPSEFRRFSVHPSS